MILTLTILMNFTLLFAPAEKCLYIQRGEAINPYEVIWEATIKVESSGNPLAYHLEENGFPSVGIAQVQQSRLDDFNKRTGVNYSLTDMYQPELAKRVFLYYASEFHPSNTEAISRSWNGGNNGMSKKSTLNYYRLIKSKL